MQPPVLDLVMRLGYSSVVVVAALVEAVADPSHLVACQAVDLAVVHPDTCRIDYSSFDVAVAASSLLVVESY